MKMFLGDLWPPIIQVIMGLERVVAVYKPVYFKAKSKTRSVWLLLPLFTHLSRSFWTISLSVLFVIASLAAGFIIAWLNRGTNVSDSALEFVVIFDLCRSSTIVVEKQPSPIATGRLST